MSKQRKRYCGISTCSNKNGTHDSMFRVPRYNLSLREQWISAILAHEPKLRDSIEQYTNVCHLHFDLDDIIADSKSQRKHLRPGSVPKYFEDPLAPEKEPTDVLVKVEPPDSVQSPQSNIRLVKIVLKKNTNVFKPPEKASVCMGCLDNEAEMNAMHQRISDIEDQMAERRGEMNYLKKSVQCLLPKTSKKMSEPTKCALCHTELMTKSHLYKHLCIKNVQIVQCDYCSLSFGSTFKLLQHLEIFHDDKTFLECDQCDSKFEMSALLDVHKTTHHGHENASLRRKEIPNGGRSDCDDLQCGSCGERYATLKMLRFHEKKHRTKARDLGLGTQFECYICKHSMQSLNQVRFHLYRDHRLSIGCSICKCILAGYQLDYHLCRCGDEIITCEYCPKTFVSVVGVTKHLKDDHNDKTVHQCNACSQYFPMKLLLDYHSIFHEKNERSHTCHICSKRYFSATHLYTHIRNIHERENFHLCVECGKSFKRKYELKLHIENHAEKTIKCPDCPMTFKHIRALNSHREQHVKMNYICRICNVEVKSRIAHRKHMLKHTRTEQDKKHSCQYCPMKFFNKQDLSNHIRTHTGEKPFECQYCSLKFGYKKSLKDHLRKHLGDKVYGCDKCDERFKNFKDLQDHLMEHCAHDMEIE